MNARTLIFALASLVGCSSSPSPEIAEAHEAQRAALEAAERRVSSLEAELAARRAEMRQLESELALLRAERFESTRIERDPEPAPWDEPEVDERGRAPAAPSHEESRTRVTLKLYGEGAPDDGAAYARKPSSSDPAPVEREARTLAAASRPAEAAGEVDPYRDALEEIRARRLERALPLLERAIEEATSLERRVDAVYWRGEVLYLLGRHAEAEVEFASIVSADIEHARVPPSLLRLGQCRKLRGLDAEAEAIFEKLRGAYPESRAAAQAPREGV